MRFILHLKWQLSASSECGNLPVETYGSELQAFEFYHTFALLLANNYQDTPAILPYEQRLGRGRGLILEIADHKNDYADVAAEKLFRKCSTSWGAYQYLQDRVHDGWLPDSARQQLRQIIKRIQVQIYQCREYGYA